MPVYRTRPGAESYGHAIGILLLDVRLPFIPGDVANVSTFRYPVMYEAVPGLSLDACIERASEYTGAVVVAAKRLEARGVRGLSSNCGFMLHYQEAVRESVEIPVCLSSLLQLPLMARSVDPARPIGIITDDSTALTPEFLAGAGLRTPNPVVVRGLRNPFVDGKGTLDSDEVTTEVVRVARNIFEENRQVGAILLACAMLPPYAKAVQDAVECPVYDFVTMIDYLQSATHQRRHQGIY